MEKEKIEKLKQKVYQGLIGELNDFVEGIMAWNLLRSYYAKSNCQMSSVWQIDEICGGRD
jgi:hypothetical protein